MNKAAIVVFLLGLFTASAQNFERLGSNRAGASFVMWGREYHTVSNEVQNTFETFPGAALPNDQEAVRNNIFRTIFGCQAETSQTSQLVPFAQGEPLTVTPNPFDQFGWARGCRSE